MTNRFIVQGFNDEATHWVDLGSYPSEEAAAASLVVDGHAQYRVLRIVEVLAQTEG